MKHRVCPPPMYGIQMHPIFLVILHITLFVKVKTSSLAEADLLLKMCIGGTIMFFILDFITTSISYHSRLQRKISLYMVFPAIASLALYWIDEVKRSYSVIMINVIVSIVCAAIGLVLIVLFIIMKFYERYFEKEKIECGICEETYIVRAKEYRKHMDYANLTIHESIEDKPVIICMKCLESDPRFKNSKIINNKAPDFTLINPKAKRLVTKKVTTVIDGEKLGTQVFDIEVNT
jgi:hypothetical protein